jgi:hypothetical protein
MIQLGERACTIFSLSLVSQETGKANKNVSDRNVQQSPGGQEFVWDVSY